MVSMHLKMARGIRSNERRAISEKAVPKIQLNATHESALDRVDLDIIPKSATEEASSL